MLGSAPSVSYSTDLHVWQSPRWSPDPSVALQEQKLYNASVGLQQAEGWPFTDERPWIPQGGMTYDADYIAAFINTPDELLSGVRKSQFGEGMKQVQTIQFLPGGDATVEELAAAIRGRFPLFVKADGTSLVETRFQAEQDLEAYVKDPNYGMDSMPGVCTAGEQEGCT
jgi:hypothetical protein